MVFWTAAIQLASALGIFMVVTGAVLTARRAETGLAWAAEVGWSAACGCELVVLEQPAIAAAVMSIAAPVVILLRTCPLLVISSSEG